MMFCDLKEEPSSMFNDSSGDTEQMESQGFEASGPPRGGKAFRFITERTL